MTEIKSLVLEHLHALLKRQDDMHADLREMRMCMRAMNGQLSSLDHLVSALVTEPRPVMVRSSTSRTASTASNVTSI